MVDFEVDFELVCQWLMTRYDVVNERPEFTCGIRVFHLAGRNFIHVQNIVYERRQTSTAIMREGDELHAVVIQPVSIQITQQIQ